MRRPWHSGWKFAGLTLWCLIALLMGFVVNIPAGTSHAQGPVAWDTPVNLSGTATSSEAPTIVADPYGMVHVFWGEHLSEATNYTNAIMYTRWDGQGWSPAHDVLLSPEGIGARAGRPSAALGKGGDLYIVFTGGWSGSIYFSASPVLEAARASAWREPMLLNESVAGADEARIAVDSQGIIHVVFNASTGSEQGVYHTRSEDGGQSWSPLQQIPGSLLGSDTAVFEPRIAVDSHDRLHTAWSWAGLPDTYPPKGIWYARSTDKGESWSTSTLVADGLFRCPDIATQADGTVHLFWSGTLTQRFKFHQSSRDGGVTWSQPWVFSKLGGLQGYVGAAEDSSGVLHLVMATNYVGEVPEVLVHSQWADNQWSEPEIILRDTHGFAVIGEDLVDAASVVTEGDILHIVVQYPVVRVPVSDQQRDIFYVRGHTRAPHIEPIPLPTISPGAPSTSESPKVVSATATTLTPNPTQVAWNIGADLQPAPTALGSKYALGVSVMAVILVLLAIVLVQRWRR